MKSVLITGAYGGMGKATAQLLASKGIKVFALDKNVEEKAENIIPVKADITDKSSVEEAFSFVKSQTEVLFAVIHFAGIYQLNSLVEISESDYDKIYDINVKGVFLINKVFLPVLSKNSRIIITTSELAALYPLPFTGIYAVTKTALDRYAYSLKMELQLLNVNVSVLRAGAVKTNMLGASTTALDEFCDNTKLYSFSAKRFKNIVNRVEARHVLPQKIANKTFKILGKKDPAFVYSVNRNPLLIILNLLPKRLQFFVIKLILK